MFGQLFRINFIRNYLIKLYSVNRVEKQILPMIVKRENYNLKKNIPERILL